MSLDRLLQLESPTEKQVIAQIGPGFYRDAWSLRSRLKPRLLNLLSDNVIRATAGHIRLDLESSRGIDSLECITNKKVTDGFASVFGFKKGSPIHFKQKLVDYGVFPLDLGDYENKEKIFRQLIAKLAIRTAPSPYFSSEFVKDPLVLDSNRRLFANSQAFRDYLNEQGVTSLNDIKNSNSLCGIGSILGFKAHCPNPFRRRLIEYGVFSVDLSNYDNTDEIFRNVLNRFSENNTSIYFSSEFVKESLVLDSNRRLFVNSKAFAKYLENEGIASLDDLCGYHLRPRMGYLLGFNNGQPNEFKKKLIEWDVFSLDLSNYINNEKIFENLIINPKFNSIYFSRVFVTSAKVLESNRSLFVNSKAFAKHLKNEGVTSLDDINSYHAKSAIGSLLGFKGGNATSFIKKLIHYDLFSIDLSDYKNTEQIFKALIAKKRTTSPYFLTKFVTPAILESNRYLFVDSKAFAEHLNNLEIKSLDDVNYNNAGLGVGFVFGFKQGQPVKFRRKLIDYGVFSTDLRYCDNTEEIFRNVVKRFSDMNFTRTYFSSKFVTDSKVLESNRCLFANSKAFAKYLKTKGITSLDGVNGDNLKSSICHVFGFNIGNPNGFKKKLIEYSVFSLDLSNYENIEEICQKTITGSSLSGVNSAYFSKDVPHETLLSNRKKFIESETFLDFLTEQEIYLDDLDTVKSYRGKTLFRKVLGVDIKATSAQSDLETVLRPPTTNTAPRFRKIVTEWGKIDESYLLGIFQNHGPQEDPILDYMDQNQRGIEEDLGRTLFACKMKMADMGLISQLIQWGPDRNGRAVITYPFPQIHEQREPRVINQFNNYSRLLERGLQSVVIPVYAYEAVATYDNGTSQFTHVTVPIRYIDSQVGSYNTFEQNILSTIQQYIADPDSFTPENNYLVGEPAGDRVNILALNQDSQLYTQVFLRRRFSINPNNISTNAIRLANGSEIYFFKHNQANVTFESIRRHA